MKVICVGGRKKRLHNSLIIFGAVNGAEKIHHSMVVETGSVINDRADAASLEYYAYITGKLGRVNKNCCVSHYRKSHRHEVTRVVTVE